MEGPNGGNQGSPPPPFYKGERSEPLLQLPSIHCPYEKEGVMGEPWFPPISDNTSCFTF